MNRRELMQATAATVAAAAAGQGGVAHAAGPSPIVTGPIQGGRRGWPFGAFLGDIGALGYVEEEYFIAAEATRYRQAGPLGMDGKWAVEPDGAAPYKTRLLVRRPRDPARFNGTVILEWINVTNGFEVATIGTRAPGVYADGFAFVTASCQLIGLNGFAKGPQGLKVWDPDRYGSLSIPSDTLSFDIFSQAGRAVGPRRSRAGPDPLGGLAVRKVIAAGASQSAVRLTTYINAIQPRERVFDAMVPLIDFGTGFGFDEFVFDPTILPPDQQGRMLDNRTRFRDDGATPIMVVNSEYETLRYYGSRQPDSDRFRFWEIAGAAHAPAPNARLQQALWARDGVVTGTQGILGSEVEWRPTADAAFLHVHRWINGGPPPPRQPPVEVISGPTPTIRRDAFGNALGGVRLPEVEVPIASYTGVREGPPMTALRGSTTPFSEDLLKRLYPTRETYVQRVAAAAQAAEAAGVIPSWRVGEYIEAAKTTPL